MKSRCLRVAAFFFFPQKKKALTGAFLYLVSKRLERHFRD